MSTDRQLRRTDLLLVRVWTQGSPDGSGVVEWRGKVQRVVDGEAHQVDSWQALVDTLRTMLSTVDGAGSADPKGAINEP